ncbi:unnamed protein product [Effrenium voratum]|uniref:Uncharacterized protein n=1 Tax=Effrenium voratum TaxID=2562239 RepID=A0AA36JSZ0_9DINO|nr:unnamed protein product [Effrenium voratum]
MDCNLFTWGDNQHGQLGDGSLAPRQTPELVGEVLGVVRAAAAEATAVVTKSGQLFAWGFGGRRSPAPVSLGGRRASSVAVAAQVLCCCTPDRELVVVRLGEVTEAWLAHDNIIHAAASRRCIVALAQALGSSGHKPPGN